MQTRMNIIGILILALLIVLPLGVIVSIFPQLRQRALKITGVVILVYAVLFVLSMFVSRISSVRVERGSVSMRTNAAGGRLASKTAWQLTTDLPFETNVYPSMPSAVRGVGARVAGAARSLVGDTDIPKTVKFVGTDDDRKLLNELANAVKNSLCQRKINWTIESHRRPEQKGELWIECKVIKPPGVAPRPSSVALNVLQPHQGTIELLVSTAGKKTTLNASFVDKPWVDNFTEFINRKPERKNSLWFVGRSKLCATPQEARSQVVTETVDCVFKHARPKLRDQLGRRSRFPWHRRDEQWLRNQVRHAVQTGPILADGFTQSFQRDYGMLWRTAVLIDISDYNLQPFVANCRKQLKSELNSWTATALSVAALLAVICIAYAFLNAATRGYYVWALRVAAVVLMALLVLILA